MGSEVALQVMPHLHVVADLLPPLRLDQVPTDVGNLLGPLLLRGRASSHGAASRQAADPIPRHARRCQAALTCAMTASLALRYARARFLFSTCVRASAHRTVTPVGRCLIRTAVSTLFTFCEAEMHERWHAGRGPSSPRRTAHATATGPSHRRPRARALPPSHSPARPLLLPASS